MNNNKIKNHSNDSLFFTRSNLDNTKVDNIVSDALHKADDGELFMEFCESESFVFDDQRLKSASFDTSKGFGLRAIAGESSGYAHSSDIDENALKKASETVNFITKDHNANFNANFSKTNRKLYNEINPINETEFSEKVETLKKINPETTLFIIVSKTFTTQETITNANSVKKWFLSRYPNGDLSKHFIAVSSSVEKAKKFGISEDYIFPMEDWVGGRFSFWGSVGLSIMLSIGPDNFEEILEGAYEMDQHFKNIPFENNIPVILALISIWYNNFFKAETEVVIPYSEYLKFLPSYLQQAVMESNGKNYDRNGSPVSYETGNIIWGSTGTNSQHAFFQFLHQTHEKKSMPI